MHSSIINESDVRVVDGCNEEFRSRKNVGEWKRKKLKVAAGRLDGVEKRKM